MDDLKDLIGGGDSFDITSIDFPTLTPGANAVYQPVNNASSSAKVSPNEQPPSQDAPKHDDAPATDRIGSDKAPRSVDMEASSPASSANPQFSIGVDATNHILSSVIDIVSQCQKQLTKDDKRAWMARFSAAFDRTSHFSSPTIAATPDDQVAGPGCVESKEALEYFRDQAISHERDFRDLEARYEDTIDECFQILYTRGQVNKDCGWCVQLKDLLVRVLLEPPGKAANGH